LIDAARRHTGHPFASVGQSVALPYSLQRFNISTLVVPLLERYIAMSSPADFVWTEEANDDVIAMWRILLRKTICDATASREFNIRPQNPAVADFIIAMILFSMSKVVERMSSVPSEGDYDNSTCQVMRGLYGTLLSTMASGTKPHTMLWKLVVPGSNLELPEENEWWMVRMMMQTMPYTGWDTSVFDTNIKKLFVRLLRKKITDPATAPLRSSIKVSAMAQKKAYLVSRLYENVWRRLACDVFDGMEKSDCSATNEMAARLLELYGGIINPKKTTSFLKHFFTLAMTPDVERGGLPACKVKWDGAGLAVTAGYTRRIREKNEPHGWKTMSIDPDMDEGVYQTALSYIRDGGVSVELMSIRPLDSCGIVTRPQDSLSIVSAIPTTTLASVSSSARVPENDMRSMLEYMGSVDPNETIRATLRVLVDGWRSPMDAEMEGILRVTMMCRSRMIAAAAGAGAGGAAAGAGV